MPPARLVRFPSPICSCPLPCPPPRPKAGHASWSIQRGHTLLVPFLTTSPLCPRAWLWELSALSQRLQGPGCF